MPDTVLKFQDGIEISNFDEVKAHMRNELSRANKPLVDAIKKIKGSENSNVMVGHVDKLDLRKEFNLTDKELSAIIDAISGLKESIDNLPAPQVNVAAPIVDVKPPEVNVTTPDINIPEVNLDGLIKELRLSLNKLRTNKLERPIYVRSMGEKQIVDALKDLKDTTVKGIDANGRLVAGFSNEKARLVDIRGKKINPATAEGTDVRRGELTHSSENVTATAAQFTNNGADQITIQNTGTNIVYIGGSTVSSSSYAFKLVPTQMFEFGKVKETFSFYHVSDTGKTSTIGVASYA